jgi:TolA-binding protein
MIRRTACCVVLAILGTSSATICRADEIAELKVRVMALEKRCAELEVGLRALQAQARPEERVAAKRADARQRMRRDVELYTPEQLREIESLYQVANQKWQSEAARKSLRTLVEKYPKANRTGCALLYLGQMTHDDEQIAYLKQVIADHGDCFYGDGVQVGAYARFVLAQVYLKGAKPEKAKSLLDEIRSNYADAIDHEGHSLPTQLP